MSGPGSSLHHRAHAAHSFQPKCVWHMQPAVRLQYASELLKALFGEDHTRVGVHMQNKNDARAPIQIRVELYKGADDGKANLGIAQKLILRNALNSASICYHEKKASGNKKARGLLSEIVAVTSCERILRAERAFGRRERFFLTLEVAAATTVVWVVWESLLFVWSMLSVG